MIELAWIGMVIIIVSWIIQIVSVLKSKREILVSFVGLQALGILLLVVSEFLTNSTLSILAILNILSMIGAIVVAILLIKK